MFGSKKLIGLDIGTSSIKMAELSVSGQNATLERFMMTPTPPGSLANGDVADGKVLSAAIRQLANQLGLQKKKVSLGLTGSSVIVKKITIPKIDAKLISEQVRWEAEQYVPFDIQSIHLTHHVLSFSQSADTIDLLLIATPNSIVDVYAQVTAQAGLDLRLLDVSSFALANIFEFNYGKSPQVIALLHFGASAVHFVVLQKGEVIFTRDMTQGGQATTFEISKELGVTLLEAESLKLGAIRGDAVPDEVQSVISSSNEALREEVKNSFDYFYAVNSNLSVQHIFYSGGSSLTPGMMELISKTVSAKTESLDPFRKIGFSPKNLTGTYVQQVKSFSPIALGLALRKMGDT